MMLFSLFKNCFLKDLFRVHIFYKNVLFNFIVYHKENKFKVTRIISLNTCSLKKILLGEGSQNNPHDDYMIFGNTNTHQKPHSDEKQETLTFRTSI